MTESRLAQARKRRSQSSNSISPSAIKKLHADLFGTELNTPLHSTSESLPQTTQAILTPFEFHEAMPGKIYVILTDKNIQLNARFKTANKLHNESTVNCPKISAAGIQIKHNKLLIRADKPPKLNRDYLAPQKLYMLSDGTAIWDEATLTLRLSTPTYTFQFQQMELNQLQNFLIMTMRTAGDPFADGTLPHGLWGQTLNPYLDNPPSIHKTIDAFTSTGVIAKSKTNHQTALAQYETHNLFGNTSRFNRFGFY